MNRLPPSTPASTSCPEADTLAAYVDRRLSEDERRATEAHLDTCEACYSVFVDTVTALDHVAPSRTLHGKWRRVGLTLSLAAAAGLGAVLLGPIWRGGPPAGGRGTNPVAVLTGGADPRALRSAWEEIAPTRGAEAADRERMLAFRLGVNDADLEIALRTDDQTRAREMAQTAVSILGPRAAFYEGLLSRLRAGDGAASLAEEIASAAGPRQAGLAEREWQHGRWTETARRAAFARQLNFFRNPEVRERLLEAALAAPLGGARRLEEALNQIGAREPDPAAWESLATALGELIRDTTP